MTELRSIDELTPDMEVRRADGTWVRVVKVERDPLTGVHMVDLVDGKFVILTDEQAIVSREVES